MGDCAWPAVGRLGLARVRVSRVRARVSVRARARVRTWPKSERPTFWVPTECCHPCGALPLALGRQVRVR